MTHDGEICGKRGCDKPASIILKVYTTEGADYVPFCMQHMLLGSTILEQLAQSMVMGDG